MKILKEIMNKMEREKEKKGKKEKKKKMMKKKKRKKKKKKKNEKQEEKQEEKKEEEEEEKKEEEKEERKEEEKEERKKEEKEEMKEEKEKNELKEKEREREINNECKSNKIKIIDIEKEKEQRIKAINFNTNEHNSTHNNIINNNSKNLDLNLDNTSERKLCTNSSNPFNNKNINISFGSEEFYKLLPKIPKKNIPEFFSNSEMNFLEYKHSCDYDRRSFLQIYSSILKEENNLVFSFSYCNDDFNLSLVKLSFFIIQIILYITFTCFFFTDDTINKIKDLKYEIKSLIYIIKPVVFTFAICLIINILLNTLSKINNNVLEIKYERINYKDGLKK